MISGHSGIDDLAKQLRSDYDSAPAGRQAASIHLFGIRHADALRGFSKSLVAERAGLPKSYGTEINKGVQLADYVEIVKPLA